MNWKDQNNNMQSKKEILKGNLSTAGGNELLWLFSGISTDYILKVCCVQAVDYILRLRLAEIGGYLKKETNCMDRTQENRCAEQSETVIFAKLRRQSLAEFYTLLKLNNLTYREQLQGDIFDYLQENNRSTINLWGYFDFRLPVYQRLLEKAVDNTVNCCLEQMDYRRCLQAVEDMASAAAYRTRILHIIFTAAGGFILLNENNEVLESAEIKEEMNTAAELGLKHDDVLLAVFVYYAPERIIVHNFDKARRAVSSSVWDLAGVPVDFCSGCSVCCKYIAPIFLEV